MNHEQFVMSLDKQLPGGILAYDQKDDACVLLVVHDHVKITVTIPSSLITMRQEEAINVLCERLRARNWTSWHMKLASEGKTLVLEDLA